MFPADSRAFTLLEVLCVIAILGGIAIAISTYVGPIDQRRAIVAADSRLGTALSKAKYDATTSGIPQLVIFRKERIEVVVGGAVSWSIGMPRGLALSITAAQEIAGRDASAVAFFPDGTTTGGDVSYRMGMFEARRSIDWFGGVRVR